MIQKRGGRLVYNQPKKGTCYSLLIQLHWLPICPHQIQVSNACLQSSLGSAPTYLNALLQTYTTSRPLGSSDERRLALPPGIATCFSTFYILNLQYQEEAACTLEFFQRKRPRRSLRTITNK
ncbi:hypothetical protein AALO_G00121480 [Alosa alosa]|uniref:Uncharacterized protein n=1 Tax=Alosa alosa TaxID=278164 RepID=A0AAV6GPU2_9TELE|nr:hypothetical protein AALO_G00121480 [Alosa alosa]